VGIHPRLRNSSRVPGLTTTGNRLRTRHYLSLSSPSAMKRMVSAAAGLQSSAAVPSRAGARHFTKLTAAAISERTTQPPRRLWSSPSPRPERGQEPVVADWKGEGVGRKGENEKQNRGRKDSGGRAMLSAQGYRLCHLHRHPIRGWRGRLSEDKFSTLGHPHLQSPRATLPPPNQRQNCSPPPIRAEQWGGTKGKDQGRLRSGPAAAAAIALN